jgi:hydroxymethylglutaryl-CoA lyase
MSTIKLIECPRDAMQGWKDFIPTEDKINYLNKLMQVGFDVIDFGSFVSAKHIPQLKDTREVLGGINRSTSNTKLLAIVANLRGAVEATSFTEVDFIGYPFSISNTFQLRNTNATIEQSVETVKQIQEVCIEHGKKLVIYISMAFGNPYGDEYSQKLVFDRVENFTRSGIEIISLADTVGVASPEQVFDMSRFLTDALPGQEIGVHLHSGPANREAKLQAALDAGIRRFDGALRGIGGCPMANDELVGNMNTELMIPYFQQKGFKTNVNTQALQEALAAATKLFNNGF